MSYDGFTILLRTMAALVWTGVFVLIARNHWDTTYLRRVLVTASLVIVLWAVALGGVAGIGLFPGDAARVVYTAVATGILIIGIVLLTAAEDRT